MGIIKSVFLDHEDNVLAILHQLRAMGVRIALDDFGTGYCSLSYLRIFPFDKIKIDKSFVNSVVQDASSAAIIRAIVDLAGALDMEDTEQLAELKGQGCSSIRGFIFSQPVEADCIRGLLPSNYIRRAAQGSAPLDVKKRVGQGSKTSPPPTVSVTTFAVFVDVFSCRHQLKTISTNATKCLFLFSSSRPSQSASPCFELKCVHHLSDTYGRRLGSELTENSG